VYRQLFNPDLYRRAYAQIQANRGALTPGIADETVDGMSQAKIATIIEAIRHERWKWTPVRRVEIPKRNGKTRPLGIPTWSDKLLQEVVRSILEAYYDPQFSQHSHGFRPHRGCHTALTEIHQTWAGTKWFIEGDIKGCFDSIDHSMLLTILQERINDKRFIRLIEALLKAGYCEVWTYHPTYSGTPQGGVMSPILFNIYMDRLDRYVHHTLLPEYTRGNRRKTHPEYERLRSLGKYYRTRGRSDKAEILRKQAQAYPSGNPNDPDYRRLRYVRYADDFLLGLIGSQAEAEEIKAKLTTFLRTQLNLTLATEKTLVTHALTGRARFLGYHIGMMQSQTRYDTRRARVVNGKVGLYIPVDVIENRCKRYMQNGKAIHRAELLTDSEFETIQRYQWEYRGLVEYYGMALNLACLSKLRWIMETSLLKTLASKNRTTVVATRKRLQSSQQTLNGPRRCLRLTIPREGKKPLVAVFGGLSLKRQIQTAMPDKVTLPYINRRSGLLERLLRDTCEVCGATEHVEMHHIRKLANLTKKGPREKPLWMQIMIARSRKTLAVCRTCHMDIHYNRPQSKRQGNRKAG
jgi:group II intron reverse transcriptase/maturase